jgi:hypothetical protein
MFIKNIILLPLSILVGRTSLAHFQKMNTGKCHIMILPCIPVEKLEYLLFNSVEQRFPGAADSRSATQGAPDWSQSGPSE